MIVVFLSLSKYWKEVFIILVNNEFTKNFDHKVLKIRFYRVWLVKITDMWRSMYKMCSFRGVVGYHNGWGRILF